jgi:hypothetical protein
VALTGVNLYTLPDTETARQQRSTQSYVGEQECMGYFDCPTPTTTFLSLGPCHWTLPIYFPCSAGCQKRVVRLPIVLLQKEPAAYEAVARFFGLDVTESWGVNGATLWVEVRRNIPPASRLQKEDSAFGDLFDGMDTAADKRAKLEFFGGWHWVYHFQMAGRTSVPFRRRMSMARLRLHDLGNTEWPTNSAPGAHVGEDLGPR